MRTTNHLRNGIMGGQRHQLKLGPGDHPSSYRGTWDHLFSVLASAASCPPNRPMGSQSPLCCPQLLMTLALLQQSYVPHVNLMKLYHEQKTFSRTQQNPERNIPYADPRHPASVSSSCSRSAAPLFPRSLGLAPTSSGGTAAWLMDFALGAVRWT